MTMVNRETSRDALATLLTTEMVNGTPQLAQAVYNYQKFDFGGTSPVVLVYSGGAERPTATMAGSRTSFQIWVAIFVSTTASGSYTEADAEDRLDHLERALAEVIDENRSTANWTHIAYDGRSLVQDVELGGVPYIAEYVPLEVQVFG